MSINQITTIEQVGSTIRYVRGQKVILDRDLARLYGVETRALNQAVKRNRDRFPPDFMFQLNKKEYEVLISQSVISNKRGSHRGGRRTLPLAFTEQGVAMLSSVLKSPRAAQVNISIMRTFVRLREVLATNQALAKRLDDIQRKMGTHDKNFELVFEAIAQLLKQEKSHPVRQIGFGRNEK